MAITSLVLGIASFPSICCYGLPAIGLGVTALILGRISLRKIRASGGALSGQGLAQAGWITGIVGGALGLIVTVVMVVVYGLAIYFAITHPHVSPTP